MKNIIGITYPFFKIVIVNLLSDLGNDFSIIPSN